MAANDPLPMRKSSEELQTRETVLNASEKLDDWFLEGQATLDIDLISTCLLEDSIARQLQQWLVQPTSRILCLETPVKQEDIEMSTFIAAQFISVATEMDMPLLSFFCSLPRGPLPPGRIPETVALCELTASLMRQMIAILPEPLPAGCPDLRLQRFEGLDGTLRSWDQILEVFTDLLTLMPPTLLIVIDGIQWLDSAHTCSKIGELVAAIKNGARGSILEGERVAKALFTTAGHSRGVVPLLHHGEYTIYDGPEIKRI